ncbi:MAG TPA: hypothetical protein VHZ24_09860 [Pirellulales bacterium]|nr:hypothetical protein [Pirellulales bacterium]
MSGPIVRSGASATFAANWENVFGGKKKKTSAAKPAPAKPAKKSAKKKAAKKK